MAVQQGVLLVAPGQGTSKDDPGRRAAPVNQGGLALRAFFKMGFKIADGVIARVRVAERVAIIVGAGFGGRHNTA